MLPNKNQKTGESVEKDQKMMIKSKNRSIRMTPKKYVFILFLVLGNTVIVFSSSYPLNQSNHSFASVYQEPSMNSNKKQSDEKLISFKTEITRNEDPEAYFPNFLYYSTEIANVLIDYLFDNDSGGFYVSADEHWQQSSINPDKRTYDQAQAILAFLKLSQAVINETERDFAVDIASKVGEYLIRDLYDGYTEDAFGGFFISSSNRYKKPGIQAKAIQAFLALYEETGNTTYRDSAIDTFDFLETFAWNNSHGFYIYLTAHSGIPPLTNPNQQDPYDPLSKRMDHNILMGQALLDLYRLESEQKYLDHAIRIYDYFNATCRNITSALFYTGLNSLDEIVDLETSDIFINSLTLEFLGELYNVTEDPKYYDEFFALLNSVLNHFWDSRYGGLHALFSYDNNDITDDKKYTERQFYGIRALDYAFKLTDSNIYYNFILDIVEFLTNKLYDNDHGGYYQLRNTDGAEGETSWNDKYTVTQSLAIYALANLWLYSKPGVLSALWSPSTPLPGDDVTILIAAFDADGISNVLFNYSINNEPYQTTEMVPHSLIGNMYNTTLEAHSVGTRVNFNIIVNDSLGHQAVRSSYFFTWQLDTWAPQIIGIGLDPGIEIPVNENFTITATAQDVPVHGNVKYVRIYYHRSNKPETSQALTHNDVHIWQINFPNGLPIPGTYNYYFEAIDFEFNFGYSPVNTFYILGHPEIIPLSLIVGIIVTILVVVPSGLYVYVELEKKKSRRGLKGIREVKHNSRKGLRKKRRMRRGQTNDNTTEVQR
jgi:hypothetical protein